MRIISEREIREFLARRPEATDAMSRFVAAIRAGGWHNPAELRRSFPHVSFVKDWVIFNIGGNHYRLAAFIHYRNQIVYIKQIGTHREYDQWEL